MISFFVSALLSASFAATSPVQSKEEIKFVSKAESPLMGTFKVDSYLGTIGRVDEKRQDLSMVDIYSFKDTKKIAMDNELCKAYLSQIYGPLDHITLQIKSVKLYRSHTGSTCEAQIDDPLRDSSVPERRVIIGFLNAKPYALEFSLAKKSDTATQENTRKFWDSLR